MQTELTDPPVNADEKATVLGFLNFQQQVFFRKLESASGALLSESALTKALPPSTMTLKGMAAHLWYVEDYWRDKVLLGKAMPEPWASTNWDEDSDADWHSELEITEILAELKASIAKTQTLLTKLDWDTLSLEENQDNLRFSVRWIALHLVEEWGRHLGHADLLRENIDGSVGD